jgi:hypothetical protein
MRGYLFTLMNNPDQGQDGLMDNAAALRHSAKNNCPVSSDQGAECTVSVYPQDISGGFISYRVPKAGGVSDLQFDMLKLFRKKSAKLQVRHSCFS